MKKTVPAFSLTIWDAAMKLSITAWISLPRRREQHPQGQFKAHSEFGRTREFIHFFKVRLKKSAMVWVWESLTAPRKISARIGFDKYSNFKGQYNNLLYLPVCILSTYKKARRHYTLYYPNILQKSLYYLHHQNIFEKYTMNWGSPVHLVLKVLFYHRIWP